MWCSVKKLSISQQVLHQTPYRLCQYCLDKADNLETIKA